MSITCADIRTATFTSALAEVEELTLTNRGLIDLGSITEALNLRIVNLSFNKLTGLKAVAGLTSLSSLNVSHNHVTSLKGLSSLHSLTALNASYNKISSLGPISSLVGLRDLYCQHNALPDPPSLQPLSALSGLQRLCLAPNPLSKVLDGSCSRLLLLRLCTTLQVLDATPYTAEERDSSAIADAEEAARQLAVFRPATPTGPLTSLTLSQLQASSPDGTPSSTSMPALLPGPKRMSGHESGLPSAPGFLPGRPQARAAQPSTSGRTRSASPGPRTRSLISDHSDTRSEPSTVFDPNDTADRDSLASTSSSRGSMNSSGKAHAATQGRRGGGSNFLPRIKTIPEGSSFMAVLDKLPKLDPVKLPPSFTPSEGIAKKAPPVRPPAETQTVEYECRYPRHAQSRAVTVRRDGSLVSYWPNGDLAVTVDLDYAASEPVYRLFAVYRNGNIAGSFDTSAGGFIQYPNGNVAVIINREGGGTMYKPSGDIITKWSSSQDTDTSSSGFVDLQLDGSYGIRYIHRKGRLQVYLACEGLRYVVVCGQNMPGAAWDPGQGTSKETGWREDDDLPPPPFLAHLAQEGPAAGTARATLTRKDAADAAAPRSISSITDSLKALDDSLSAWAMDRTGK